MREWYNQRMTATRISLVLSSGGARGLAHIGAIQCLEEEGYDIRYISGSSMGALIGGIHAAGKLDDYAIWVKALRRKDIVQLLDFGWGHGGLFKGERIIDALRDLIGEHIIEELPIGFTAVASDLRSKREIWLNKGPLFSAIRASIAVPLVFSPVTIGNKLLIDGGVLNPLPIAPTLNNETDLTVAVDVNGRSDSALNIDVQATSFATRMLSRTGDEMEDKFRRAISVFIENLLPKGGTDTQDHGMLGIAMEAMDAMQVSIARHQLSIYSPDVTVQIPRNAAHFFDFERAHELIEFGYEQMRISLKSLKSLKPNDPIF
jgi:NTE family protein